MHLEEKVNLVPVAKGKPRVSEALSKLKTRSCASRNTAPQAPSARKQTVSVPHDVLGHAGDCACVTWWRQARRKPGGQVRPSPRAAGNRTLQPHGLRVAAHDSEPWGGRKEVEGRPAHTAWVCRTSAPLQLTRGDALGKEGEGESSPVIREHWKEEGVKSQTRLERKGNRTHRHRQAKGTGNVIPKIRKVKKWKHSSSA